MDCVPQDKTPQTLEHALYDESIHAARFISGKSIDPSTRNGAVVWATRTGPNSEPELDVLAVGYNRMPPGVDETDPLRWERSWKYKMVSHGEVTAINHAARKGIALEGALLSSFNFSCSRCASYIVESGIKSFVADANAMHSEFVQRWAADIDMSRRIFSNAGVNVVWVNRNDGDDAFSTVDAALAAGAQSTQLGKGELSVA